MTGDGQLQTAIETLQRNQPLTLTGGLDACGDALSTENQLPLSWKTPSKGWTAKAFHPISPVRETLICAAGLGLNLP